VLSAAAPAGSVLRERNFLRLWLAISVSSFGSTITTIAFPLVAVTMLHAGPAAVGGLSAAFTLPYVVIGPLAGVYADRLPRRAILIAADLFRTLVLVTIPLAAALGGLNVVCLYAAAFALGIGDVWFDIAHGSYLPALVRRERLIEAHSKLEVSQSAAQVAGPGLSGLLIQAFGLQVPILADAATFLFSAAALASIDRAGAPAEPLTSGSFRTIVRDMGAGFRFIAGHPLLRGLTARVSLWQFVSGGVFSMIVLYAVGALHLSAAQVGLLFSAMGLGVFAGANLAERISARLGVGPTIALTNLTAALFGLLIPLSTGRAAPLMLGCALFVYGFCVINYQINNASLRQVLTPDAMLGRMGATTRALSLGLNAVGALAVGGLAQAIGIRPALTVAVALGVALAGAGAFSPALRALVRLPDGVAE
jgi:predicted MFS family arabinose efflux permease